MAIEKARIKARSRNSMFLTEKRARALVAVLALAVLLGGAGHAQAVQVSITLTTGELGLPALYNSHGDEVGYNQGDTVDADVLGKIITSPTTGEGSILTIQESGLAGPGTGADPLLVTLTAQTHLDIITGLPPWPHDYHAGVIFLTKDSGKDGKNEKRGLGVRAFEVYEDEADIKFLERKIDPDSGLLKLAWIEGSKEVSGGTDFTDLADKIAAGKLNSPPHVDERVIFDFDPMFNVNARNIEVFLEDFKFDPTGKIALYIEFKNRTPLNFPLLETSDATIFTELDGDLKRWSLDFDGLSGLGTNDFVDYFTIRALDDLTGGVPKGTAEHFLINGMTVDAVFVPEPATVALLGLGTLFLLPKRKK